jgi:anti-sigma B factor antagonist
MTSHVPLIEPASVAPPAEPTARITAGHVLIPSGEDLCEDVSARLRETGLAWIKAGCLALVIDMAGVRFIDSSGLSALVAIRIAATSAGGQMVLRAPSRNVRRILGITGMLQVFDIVGE